LSVLSIVFGVVYSIFGLVFLIDCIRLRKQINAYVKYGIACGLVLVAIDAVAVPLIPNLLSITPVYLLVVMDFVAFVRITLFTCMGMYCCSILGVYDFPAIKSLRNAEERKQLFRKSYFAVTIATLVLAVGYSVILFKLTSPRISEFIKELSEAQAARLGIGEAPSLVLALAILEFAFAEEIIFRLGIQNYLARQFKLHGSRYWVAIVLTTLLWSLAHASTLDPEWVKIAQVVPLGLALGYLFRRHGVEACIAVHGLFNLVIMLLSPYLMTTSG
jgi:membrane protease YdiL (CAAX protease family)